MKIIDGLNYREWQKRNTKFFSQLTNKQKKELRAKGYKNLGWLNVQKSWTILKKIVNTPNLFEKRLQNGDLVGAINHAILEAEQAKRLAQEIREDNDEGYRKIVELAEKAKSKYASI
ncbi:MAG: hypothetical protein WBB82_03905 [Limnothrix sp.]